MAYSTQLELSQCTHLDGPTFVANIHVQSALDNPNLKTPNSCLTEVELRISFNSCVCGVNLMIRTLDHPKLKWWFALVQIKGDLTVFGSSRQEGGGGSEDCLVRLIEMTHQIIQ
jgi:hypothetical protein